jgi:replication factor A1
MLRNGTSKIRKYVSIMDDTNHSISLTIWGEMCTRNNNLKLGDILALKGARVSEFGGKSLNSADDHS